MSAGRQLHLGRLPGSIRNVLGTLHQQLGWPGRLVGLVVLPVVVLLLVPWLWLRSLFSSGRSVPSGRSAGVEGQVLWLHWSGDASEVESALTAAVELLVSELRLLTGGAPLASVEIRNPHTGFALERLPGRMTGELAAQITDACRGGMLEYGELVLNDSIVIEGVALDARGQVCHLAIDLPADWDPGAFLERALRAGFGRSADG